MSQEAGEEHEWGWTRRELRLKREIQELKKKHAKEMRSEEWRRARVREQLEVTLEEKANIEFANGQGRRELISQLLQARNQLKRLSMEKQRLDKHLENVQREAEEWFWELRELKAPHWFWELRELKAPEYPQGL